MRVCFFQHNVYSGSYQTHLSHATGAQELHKRSAVPANVMQTLDTLPIVPWIMKLRMSSNSKPWMFGSILSSYIGFIYIIYIRYMIMIISMMMMMRNVYVYILIFILCIYVSVGSSM